MHPWSSYSEALYSGRLWVHHRKSLHLQVLKFPHASYVTIIDRIIIMNSAFVCTFKGIPFYHLVSSFPKPSRPKDASGKHKVSCVLQPRSASKRIALAIDIS